MPECPAGNVCFCVFFFFWVERSPESMFTYLILTFARTNLRWMMLGCWDNSVLKWPQSATASLPPSGPEEC